jgi:AcrR family transcriptional regulator
MTNDVTTSTRGAVTERPYHHGDLRNALVLAAVQLAREGGRSAIVLREVARRVGVSPNAAYRHFASLPDLVDAVVRQALGDLAKAMQREIARSKSESDPWGYVVAVGRGYVHFALREPGLFTTAFERSGKLPPAPTDDTTPNPQDLLTNGLNDLVDAGLLPADQVESARMLAWSSVHGLSLLLLGPLSDLRGAARNAMIEATLQQVGRGLLNPAP